MVQGRDKESQDIIVRKGNLRKLIKDAADLKEEYTIERNKQQIEINKQQFEVNK
jgi:hypothetical protein